jgi:hypothetical protein
VALATTMVLMLERHSLGNLGQAAFSTRESRNCGCHVTALVRPVVIYSGRDDITFWRVAKLGSLPVD